MKEPKMFIEGPVNPGKTGGNMDEAHETIIRPALTLGNISKSYGRTTALRDITFQADAGCRLGLLGPNGAGKSTCLKIIAGLLRPDRGDLTLDGISIIQNPISIKKRLGYIPEEPHFFPYLTGREHLDLSRSLRRMPPNPHREDHLIHELDLKEVMDRPVAAYSHGMRQKLAFLLALYHDPLLLLVDEPMVGLDVYAQMTVKRLLKQSSDQGKIVIISTHTLVLVEEIATEVLILDRSRVRARGKPSEISENSNLENFFETLRTEPPGEDSGS